MVEAETERLYLIIRTRIRDFRRKSSLKQADLAKRIGLSRASIVNIEKGRQRPSLHVLYNIAQALSIEMMELVPRFSEVFSEISHKLDPEMKAHIESISAGDKLVAKYVTEFVGTTTQVKGNSDEKKTD